MSQRTPISNRLWKKPVAALAAASLISFLLPAVALAAQDLALPSMQLTLAGGAQSPEKVSVLLEILFLLTVLSVAPAIMLTVTSFTRIIIVFSFLRQAMGVQQLPPTQILASLAIFMTVIIMYPVGKLPFNTDGGGLCNNHPTHRGGITKVIEAVRQLRGEAHPAVQVANCDLALVNGIGGMLATRHTAGTLILERQ